MGRMFVPTDANGNVLNRSMGIPVSSGVKYLGLSSRWVDIMDFSDYEDRVFIGLNVKNNSGSVSIELSFDELDVGDELAAITVGPQESHAYDGLTFGPGVIDHTQGTRTRKVRARLASGSSGTQSSATIGYVANPTDGMTVRINGKVYEFSSDQSVDDDNVKVDIAATADLTYTALCSAINAADGNVYATINTGTNTVTITANAGGTDGDGIQVADGAVNPTGETFSGNTTGGSGGITMFVNVW